jgi:DNA helicase-2/ATP-dependent DNA helicase PcrA
VPDLKSSAGKLHLFLNMIEDMREMAKTAHLDEFYDTLIERTGYIRALSEKDTDENRNRIENVKELKTNIISYMKENGEDSALSGFLDEIALYTDLEQYDQNADSVVMMTMHSAKGLEFPTVFVVGIEEGMFPGARVIGDPEEMEEERRLCYVAITRAKKKLFLTCARQRMLFGRTSSNLPSRFIGEIPDEFLEKVESRPSSYSSSYGGTHRSETGYSSSGRSGGYTSYKSGGRSYGEPQKKYSVSSAPRPSASETTGFKKGDAVIHDAFGAGVIISLQPMGGDALIEIAFEAAGTKRLMLKAAAKHMKKG